MAVYTQLEIKDILIKLTKEPPKLRFIKFERLGVLIDTEPVIDDNESSLLYACSVCKKNFISAHLLDLHVTENHDSYFQLAKDKKPMYACYLEECKQMSATQEDRKDHCLRIHKFPHDFRFDIQKKKIPSKEQLMDTSETVGSAPNPFEPNKLMNFHFGHKSQKVFKNSRSKKSSPLESMSVDMKESLPEI